MRSEYARAGHEFSFLARRPSVGLVLHDLDRVAVGIFDVEVGITDAALWRFSRNLDAARGEIEPHRFGVVGLNGDVIQAVLARLQPGKQLDILAVVDFDERQAESEPSGLSSLNGSPKPRKSL